MLTLEDVEVWSQGRVYWAIVKIGGEIPGFLMNKRKGGGSGSTKISAIWKAIAEDTDLSILLRDRSFVSVFLTDANSKEAIARDIISFASNLAEQNRAEAVVLS